LRDLKSGPSLLRPTKYRLICHNLRPIWKKTAKNSYFQKMREKPHEHCSNRNIAGNRRKKSLGGPRGLRVVVQFEFFPLSKPFTKRHLDGRKRARVVISGRVARQRPFVLLTFNKTQGPSPPIRTLFPFTRKNGAQMGPDCASSLTGARDDDLFIRIGR
jgi:hypothetical protein